MPKDDRWLSVWTSGTSSVNLENKVRQHYTESVRNQTLKTTISWQQLAIDV